MVLFTEDSISHCLTDKVRIMRETETETDTQRARVRAREREIEIERERDRETVFFIYEGNR